jgi:hypothetical protein
MNSRWCHSLLRGLQFIHRDRGLVPCNHLPLELREGSDPAIDACMIGISSFSKFNRRPSGTCSRFTFSRISMRASAKLGHSAPRERRTVAE